MAKTRVTVTCGICGAQTTTDRSGYNRRLKNSSNPDDVIFYCPICYKKLRADRMKKYTYNNLTNEQKESNKYKKHIKYKLKSDIEKESIAMKISNSRKKRWESLSEDQKEIEREIARNVYKNLSNEKKKEISMKKKSYYASLSADELSKIGENVRNWYNGLTDKQKIEYKESKRDYYNNLSDEDKDAWRQRSINYWNGVGNDFIKKYSEEKKDWWDKLSNDRREELNKKRISSNKISKLNIKFENTFKNSTLISDYYITAEYLLSNNNVMHTWDFAIFDRINNKLIMVVDIDGRFYHGDNYDYNGLHATEEYDQSRFLSVPDDIKYHIIYEDAFFKSFEKMIKNLLMNYNEFISNIFNVCRMIPFPYPHYKPEVLINSYNQLYKLNCNDKRYTNISINNREGDRIINNFHHSIYSARRRDSIKSPYDAWYDDKLLRRVIENRVIYVNTLNPNKILQGFNISKVAKRVSVFSAGRAKLLIHKYLNAFDTIFDPFSGFSGRMLGAVSLDKNYIGHDISEIHVMEGNEIIRFLSLADKASINQQDILHSSGTYDCLFTCPPYGDKEQWFNVPIDKRSCDDWIDECLERFKCKRYLLVVDSTEKYKGYIVDEIVNRSHLGKSSEYVIMI